MCDPGHAEDRLEIELDGETGTQLGWFVCRSGTQLVPTLREQVRFSALQSGCPFCVTGR